MSRRTIVTSQPDVACEVCERRLLRGEQPEIFLAGGQPRVVCELCAPRAAHQGWKRGSDEQAPGAPSPRVRRGRSLFERLRQAGRPPQHQDRLEPSVEERDGPPYDFLEEAAPLQARGRAPEPGAGERPHGGDETLAPAPRATAWLENRADGASDAAWELQHALELFNAGEYPRRIASLSRSLGTPAVNVQELEGVARVVSIVVSWELCWYRYRVDFDDPSAGARLVAEGRELDELAREERSANAAIDERGAVSLTG
jgi:hypothetical protein